ncbi:sulfite exporter TauE/SafE family protein [Chondromyces crocatus]|uniref:Probable membrane transporter protein n=1 Tax=Chondromyces crocatus TaxID=52 RepID=A0A0K1EEX5_CHOCO|nr:sulfite exporter TauE/SafE family protein [Chondromyces crocatus]AKT39242.1 uncharacterized protein CMC5_033900 [Chondromyces crocatus]
MLLWTLLLPSGVLAGALTTVAGVGGGMLLLLVLSLVMSPAEALAITAPALFIGNFHRAYRYWSDVDRRTAKAFALGAVPGSLIGGVLVSSIPSTVLAWLLAGSTALAVARALDLLHFQPPPALLTPAGFGIGAASATSGGAGLLLAPVLMATGLSGTAYVATGAAATTAMHAGRIFAYGASGLVTATTLAASAMLAASLLGGNLLGERARKHLNATRSRRIETTTLVLCVGLALLGLR